MNEAQNILGSHSGPGGPYRTIRLGCTNRGRHRVVQLGVARVWPDGTISVRDKDPTDGVIAVQRMLPADADPAQPGWSGFSCRECPRTPRARTTGRFRQALIRLAALGVDRFDVSLLD